MRVNAIMQLEIVKHWKEICSCNENVMSKYRSFYNFNPCNLFLTLNKSCLLKNMINHHHPSIELITLSFLNTGTQKISYRFKC